MRYLTIAPDYTGSCIRDHLLGTIDLADLKLPKDFMQELNRWHLLYRTIIPLSDDERIKCMNEIEKLDMQGLKLAVQLEKLIPGGAKVKYFSEGKLKYL